MITREEARKLWIEALRSGKYSQTNGRLHNDKGWCCLGVACDILTTELNIKREWVTKEGFLQEEFNGWFGALPNDVKQFLGMYSVDGTSKDNLNTLALMNDSGQTFEFIANELERGHYWE